MKAYLYRGILPGGILLACWLAAPVAAAPTAKISSFTLSEPAAVPDAVLPPGRYLLKVEDYLPDRYVVAITDENQVRTLATFLAVPNRSLRRAGEQLFSYWPRNGAQPAVVRAWFYPGDSIAREFVYPKETAAALAKASQEPVPAVDPDSENRPRIANATSEDRRIIQLWSLKESVVHPENGEPKLEAEKLSPSPVEAPSAQTSSINSQTANLKGKGPAEAVSDVSPAPARRLPQTASNFAEYLIAGGLAILAGLAIRPRQFTS